MKWIDAYMDYMPPKYGDFIIVRGSKSVELEYSFMEKMHTADVCIRFHAILEEGHEIYVSEWRQSLDKVSIYEINPRLEINGDDIRIYNIKDFVKPEDWFFDLSDIIKWIPGDDIIDPNEHYTRNTCKKGVKDCVCQES